MMNQTSVVTGDDIPTLGLVEWELWQHAQRLSRRTISERLRLVRQLHVETRIQPSSIAAIELVRWLASHDEWSDSTTVTYTSYLSAWYKWLQLTDRRVDNPMVKVGRPRSPDREPRPIADRDVPRLLGTRMWGSTRVMILLGLLAGLRVHEIAHMRGEDVDLSANLLWVRGKGRKVKSVPLHPVLRDIAVNDMPREGWWFPMRGMPSEHVLPKSVSDIIGRTMRRAGVRGTPHSLRHWYATALHTGGADIRVVQELMRHKSIASTQIYTRVPDDRRREAIMGLDLMRGFRDGGEVTPIRRSA